MDDETETCSTCKHWYAEQSGAGVCSLITFENEDGAWLNVSLDGSCKKRDVDVFLETNADFHCALWEEA